MSSMNGTLEIEVEVKTPASKFHEMLLKTPYHVSNASGDKVQSCELHEGEWGKVGSIICWKYSHEGKSKVSKQMIEAVDEEKNIIVAKMLEGDLMKDCQEMRFKMQATPKGKGSVIRWFLIYKKVHEHSPDPHSMLEFFTCMSKDIDAYLMGGH